MVSLFLPCNHYILVALLIICTIYSWFQRQRIETFWHFTQNKIKIGRHKKYILPLTITIICVLLLSIWGSQGSFDAFYYHFQNIRWIEEYKIIPGLANLEDRYGFNSNYLLLSSIFTFRFLNDYAIYPLHSVIYLWLFTWLAIEIIKNNYDLKRVLALFFLAMLYFLSAKDSLGTTSTDVVSALCIFYLSVKTILYPSSLKKEFLLYMALACVIVTFKLSAAPFAILAIIPLIYSIRKKEFPALMITSIVCFLIIALWITRNIIISGYLIYPLYEVNLFDFDWQVPIEVAKEQRNFIKEAGNWIHHRNTWILNSFRSFSIPQMLISLKGLTPQIIEISGIILSSIFSYLAFASIIVVGSLTLFKKMRIEYFLLYGLLYVGIIFWWYSAKDFRFGSGVIISTLLITFVLLVGNIRKRIVAKSIYTGTIILMLTFSLYWTTCWLNDKRFDNDHPHKRSLYSVIISPLDPCYTYQLVDHEFVQNEELNIGSITVYMKDRSPRTNLVYLEKLLSVAKIDFKDEGFQCGRILDISSIETRGNSIEDGFRAKRGTPLKIKKLF